MSLTEKFGDSRYNRSSSVSEPILRVRNLKKHFPVPQAFIDRVRRIPSPKVVALDGVSFDLMPTESLGIVGESGCGKSTLARCLVFLHRVDEGRIEFEGSDVTQASGMALRQVRSRMQMVFQDPYSSLNPRMTVGAAIAESARFHKKILNGDNEETYVRRLLQLTGLTPGTAMKRPNALSGGQRQRVALARALAVEPSVIIADEIVSALDVSIQAQILNLLEELKTELGLAIVFISHDLAVVANTTDRIAVMYLGRIIEEGPTSVVFQDPQHPYTKALIAAHPDPDMDTKTDMNPLIGEIPSPLAIPHGCRFRTRCAFAEEICSEVEPELLHMPGRAIGHKVACHIVPFSGEYFPIDNQKRSN